MGHRGATTEAIRAVLVARVAALQTATRFQDVRGPLGEVRFYAGLLGESAAPYLKAKVKQAAKMMEDGRDVERRSRADNRVEILRWAVIHNKLAADAGEMPVTEEQVLGRDREFTRDDWTAVGIAKFF